MSGLARVMGPIARRVMLMVSRAVVEFVNDSTKLQSMQVSLLDEELHDNVERFQTYGFTSVPHAGAEAIALSVGGARDHTVVVAVDDRRYRITGLQSGEVAIHTDEDCSIVFKRGRLIAIKASKVTIDATVLECSGQITAAGDIKSGAVSLTGHHHAAPNGATGAALP